MPRIYFSFGRGKARDVSFCFFILGKRDNYESIFFLILGHEWLFCVMTHFMFLFCAQGGGVNVQK
jgi:hypothetical protein